MHGAAYTEVEKRGTPISYYGPTSGIARAMAALPAGPRRVGVVGLGTGTMAAYGKAGDLYRFYELDPQVVDIASREFFYLRDSAATIEMALGDARLNLEKEDNQGFDVLIVDAFSGDSIPMHLLTKEAFSVYLRHLKSTGILVVHVSNRYLRLAPVVKLLAHAYGLEAQLVDDKAVVDKTSAFMSSKWAIVPKNHSFFEAHAMKHAVEKIAQPDWPVWTDDFNNLLQVLK
jgi:spermidine synthase